MSTAAVSQLKWTSYDQAEKCFLSHPLRTSELPISSWISLPMPTRRWGPESWVWFRSRHVVRPGKSEIGKPDRWWLIDANTRELLVYAKEQAIPALGQAAAEAFKGMAGRARTVDEQTSGLLRVGTAVDRVAEAFFEKRSAPVSNREEVLQALAFVTPEEMLPYYAAIAPDFIVWLRPQ